MNTNTIGQAIRKYRQKKNLSQDKLSKLSGVSYNTVVKLENSDKPANPTIETLKLLANALGMSLQVLLSNEK